MRKDTAAAFEAQSGELPPPGTRSGAGAQSVLPYLTNSLQAKPVEPRPSARGNPVFVEWPRRERPRP